MQETPYHKFPLYEPNDTASLIDGYNKALIIADGVIHALENDLRMLKTRVDTLEKKEN